ncbi:MAG: MATE family efflux transporter [Bacillota bacterium]|nr:MATE family efflux transporter [Bacillota bacterium]
MSNKKDFDKTRRMGEMPVGRLILTMSWPAMLSMLIQAMYNVVDSYFVAKLGEEALAAITYVTPIQFLIIAFGVGTGVGINSLIARRLGAESFDEANLAASHGYRLSIFNWLLFVIIGLFMARPIMEFMSNTPYVVDAGTNYMRIVTIGSVFILIQVSTEKILQATGNMIAPMVCSLSGAVINIVFDPILIFGLGPFPELGVTGAAVATVLSQLISFVMGQALLFGGKHSVKVSLFKFKWNARIVKDIYVVGAPAILMQSIASILLFGMNFILGGLSEIAVAVNGVYGRVQSFIFMPVFGLNQGVLPIMGYNYGARDRGRLMESYKKGMMFALVIMGIGLLIFQLFAYEIMSLFNSQGSAAMFDIGVPAMRIISLCFLPAAYGIMTSSIFQATGHGFISMWGALIRQLFGILPMAFIFAKLWGLPVVWLAYPAAELIGTIYYIISMRYMWLNEFKYIGQEKRNS